LADRIMPTSLNGSNRWYWRMMRTARSLI